MWVAALIAAGAAIGSAVIGYAAQRSGEDKARQLLLAAQDEYGKINLPKLEELVAAELPPTELAKLRTDPTLLQAQNRALDKMLEIEQAGGMTLGDLASQAEAMSKVSRRESAGRNAIREDMAARGTLGSGAELAMALDNQQDAAERAQRVGMDTAARAQDRALQAILKRGEMATARRDQDYREKSEAAKAQDLINRYNGQRMSNARQQYFDNQMRLTAAKTGRTDALAASARREGEANARLAGGVGSAVSNAAMAAGTYGASNNYGADFSKDTNPNTGLRYTLDDRYLLEDEDRY